MIKYSPFPVLFNFFSFKVYSDLLILAIAIIFSLIMIAKEIKKVQKGGKKPKHLVIAEISDLSSPYIALGLAVYMLGLFMRWKGYGKPALFPLAVWVNGIPYHPVEIYLFLGYIGIFFALLSLIRTNSKLLKKKGDLFLIFLLSYAALNFIIGFFRLYPSKDFTFGLAAHQWFSISILFVSLAALILNKKK